MNQPRYPFKFNVGFLRNQQIGTSRDIHFEYPEVILKPDLKVTDLLGTAHISRTPQGILVQGEFEGKVPAECVRCLITFDQPLHAIFDELYAFDNRSVTESGLILADDANIDLEPLIREYLLIEVPISPVCRPDCRGLCPICGIDLNETSEEHHHPELDEEIM